MRFRYLLFFNFLLYLFYSLPSGAGVTDTLYLRTEMLTVKDGLSQGLISHIMQDKDGLMWFGTKDGLNKYDGYNFTTYRHENDNPYSLPDNYIGTFVEDNNGNFWVGTLSKGLCLFDKKLERFYPVKVKGNNNSLSGNTVNPFQCRNGKLFVKENLRIIIYDVSNVHPGNYQSVDLSKATVCFDNTITLPPNRNSNYYPLLMSDNSLWCCYDDSILVYISSPSGIYKLAKSFSATLPELGAIKDYSTTELSQPNRFLFTSTKDLVVYDFINKNSIKRIEFNRAFYDAPTLQKDNSGNYFIIGEINCYYFNLSDYSLKPVKGNIRKGGCLDRNGILWMGTSGGGIIKFDYRRQLFQPVENKSTGSFKVNRNGEVVTGLNGKPALFNPYTKAVKYILPQGVWNPAWNLTEFVSDKNGGYWFLYLTENKQSRLLFYNSVTGDIQDKQLAEFSAPYPFKLIIDRDDNLWINGFDSKLFPVLMKINKNTLAMDTTYPIPAKSQNNFGYFISSYWQDANRVFWFATMQGLYSFDERKNKWKHWNNIPGNKNSLSNDYLLSILPDPAQPEKYLWLGSDGGGLSRFEIATGKFINYTDKDGLPNNVVYSILNDKAGNLWMSTNKGLSCYNPPLKTFMNFNTEDGLIGDEFNRTEYFKIPNGDLFFGGVEGGVVFNPEKILEKETAPAIVFTGLSVFNKPVTYKTDSNIIQLPITYSQTITLPHDKGMFSISFAALEYRTANKKHYKYFLEGFDKKWIDAGSKNEATYTNLSPGSYTLHVTGAGSTDVWSTREATIKIIILPAWYQTWWFRLLVAVAVAAAVYALYRYRLRKALQLQKIRNRIASDLHDEIGSTLSSISISSSIIQNKMKGSNGDVRGLLNQISSNTDNMMEAMSDIVWTINTKNDRFTNIINRMRAFAIEILEAKNCVVHFNVNKIPDDIKLDMVQRKNVYLIFKEVINNAAKYSSCKNLWIDFSLTANKKLMLKIKDDGKGFVPISLGEGHGVRLGGNGLSSIYKRAHELKGEVKILSAPEQGTEVTLEFHI